MAISLNDNILTNAPKPSDSRYGNFASVSDALSAVGSGIRYQGLTIGIVTNGVVEDYWFRDGIADSDFVIKTPDLSGYEVLTNKSTSTSLGTSNTLYPTQNAVRAFVNNAGIPKEDVSNKSTDVTLGGASPSSALYTSEYAVATYVQNEIAQAQSGIPTFEIDMFANYKLFEYDEDGATSYLGQIKATNGNWLITKFVDSSGDIAATYANESNNATYTTPATAWAARASLTYEDINDLTSI